MMLRRYHNPVTEEETVKEAAEEAVETTEPVTEEEAIESEGKKTKKKVGK